jgi:lysophospholipase L1-like esterase
MVGHHIARARDARLLGRAASAAAHALVCGALLLLAACGSSGPGPTPIHQPPSLTCPADISAIANPGQPVVVTYATPTAVNGAPPVTVSCAPGSGASFDVGTSQVACTATDAQSRAASCSFKVTVTEVPQIEKVKFLAFGDSVTAGTISSPCVQPQEFEILWHTLAVDAPASYPYKLQALLAARYASQTISVINEGWPGEKVAVGADRLPGLLSSLKPEVLLLLHGFNDLNSAGSRHTFDTEIPRIAARLEDMVKDAEQRNVKVFLANMPALDASGCRGNAAPGVPDMNDAIRHVAQDEGATLVDLYNGLGASPAGVIGIDGLHPTEEGYTKMAQVWFDAIRRELELPSTTGTAGPVITLPRDRIR